MNTNYTAQDLESTVANYKAKYGERISWETILGNVINFKKNQENFLSNQTTCLHWQGFLRYLAWIESTIGLFDYESKGPFHRTFVMFGRAYLEEKEVKESDKGKELKLDWIHESSKYFKTGNGRKGDIDLQDLNFLTYDVKNDFINFKKAHDADFLLKYRSQDGWVELHKAPTNPIQGSFVGMFAQCRPLDQIAQSLGLDPLLFNKRSSEEEIKKYLGFID